MGVYETAVGLVSQLDGFVGLITAGDGSQNVNAAGLQVFQLGLGDDLLVDDRLDLGLYAFVVALELGVELQDSGLVGSIIAGDGVGTGAGQAAVGVPGVLGHGGGQLVALAVLGIELVGPVNAFAVILQVAAGVPHILMIRREAGIGDGIEVRQIVGRNGHGELIVAQQAQAGHDLARAVNAVVGTVVGSERIVADSGHQGLVILAGSLSGNRRGEGHGKVQVVLRGHGGAIGELQIVIDLDVVGLAAVIVLGLGQVLHDRGVDDEAALFGGGDGLQAVDQAADIVIGSAGAAGAEGGITELSAQVGAVAHDKASVFLLAGPVDQSGGRTPEGVRGMLFHALDGGVVDVVVLVGVQRNLGQEIVPAGDVVLPPLGVNVVLGLIAGALGGGVIHHGHGQEVEAQFILCAIEGGIDQTGLGIFDHVRNGHAFAVLVIQRDIIPILAVGQTGNRLRASGSVDKLLGLGFGLRRLGRGIFSGLGLRRGRLFLLGTAGDHGQKHHKNQHERQELHQFLAHFCFLL